MPCKTRLEFILSIFLYTSGPFEALALKILRFTTILGKIKKSIEDSFNGCSYFNHTKPAKYIPFIFI